MAQLEKRLAELEHAHVELERSHVDLHAAHDKVSQELDEYRKLYKLLREENELLRRGLLGQRRERLPEGSQQLSLHILGEMLKDAGVDQAELEPPTQEVVGHTRTKRTGRRPLPEHLPLVSFELKPPEVERQGEDAFERIGEEVSEVLERRPASLVRVRIVRGKYVPKSRPKAAATKVLIAPPADLPIEKGLCGPGMLADTIVRRWDDHLPLNRLEKIYGRDGLDLPRSTMCGWHLQASELAQVLVDEMMRDAYRSYYLCVDATGVLVQAKGKCKSAHFWVLVAPDRHVLFRFSNRHDSLAVDDLLEGYTGHLVADAHVVYDHLYKDGSVVEVGCWAHSRRYFFKALRSDPDRAQVALSLIGELFKIERRLAGAPRKKRTKTRRQESRPVVDRFYKWCEEQRDLVLDESPISTAIGYALNQKEALRRFLGDWRLPIHNNVSERELRREAVGRKNWLFVGSEDGAQANTTFVSLLASARMHRLEPWSYLRDLFCLLPDWPRSRVLELAPVNWEHTLQDEETQRRLDANLFRAATLDAPPAHPS